MKASKILKRQIVIEILALLFLILAVTYSVFTIKKSEENKISSFDGMVSVIDNSSMSDMAIKSDGEGLNGEGTIYTITNNNPEAKKYQIIMVPKIHNTKVINQIKIGIDDIYIKELNKLDRNNGGYIIVTGTLNPGYTKSYLIKAWYKKGTTEDVESKNVDFDYRIITLDEE